MALTEAEKRTRNKEYQRAHRAAVAKKKADARSDTSDTTATVRFGPAVVSDIRRPPSAGQSGGSVAQAVRDDLEEFDLPPGYGQLKALAVSLAEIMDDADAVPQKAGAARQLQAVIAELRSVNKPATTDKLGELRNMFAPGGRSGDEAEKPKRRAKKTTA